MIIKSCSHINNVEANLNWGGSGMRMQNTDLTIHQKDHCVRSHATITTCTPMTVQLDPIC